MQDREKIDADYRAFKDAWLRNSLDVTKEFDVTVDFIWQSNQAYINQLKINNHMLTTMVIDPKVPEDTKDYIKLIISNNNKLLGIAEKEANNG